MQGIWGSRDSNFIDSSATAEDRRYCANLTYPNADAKNSEVIDSRRVGITASREPLWAQIWGSVYC